MRPQWHAAQFCRSSMEKSSEGSKAAKDVGADLVSSGGSVCGGAAKLLHHTGNRVARRIVWR